MKLRQLKLNRMVLLVFIIVVSFGLVGMALAAAGQVGKSVNEIQASPPPTQGGSQPGRSIPPSPVLEPGEPREASSPRDDATEQMRQQAMAESINTLQAQSANPGFSLESSAQSANASIAPQGAGTLYLPGGIVIDSFLDKIYGNVASYEMVNILRPPDGAYGTAEADELGFFWTPLFNGSGTGEPMGIEPGDQVDINGFQFTVGEEITGYITVLNDIVWGNIPGDTGGTVVTATLGLYGQPSTAYGIYTAVTNVLGDFGIQFAQDLGPENFALVDYKLADGLYQRTYLFPQNVFLILQHGMVSGYAPVNTNVHVTVYEGDGPSVRDQQDARADPPFGWFTAFPVIDIGDRVQVDFEGGTTEMHYVYSSNFSFTGIHQVNGNISQPNGMVRVTFLEWEGGGFEYNEAFATADANGDFTAFFPDVGIRPDTRVDVAVMDSSGAGSYMMTGQPYVEAIITFESDSDCVWGRAEQPNQDVVLKLIRDGQEYERQRPMNPTDPGSMIGGDYCYLVWYDFNDGQGVRPMNFEPGDIIQLSTPNSDPPWKGEVTIQNPHLVMNANNLVEGEILGQSGYVEVRLSSTDREFTSYRTSVTEMAFANPTYAIDFSEIFDVRAGVYADVYFYAPANGFTNHYVEQNHYFQTIDNVAVAGLGIPTEPITLFLYAPGFPDPVYYSTNDIDPDPARFYFDFGDCNQFPNCPNPPLQPGYTVEMAYAWHYTGDWQLVYDTIIVDGDVDQDQIGGYGKDGLLLITAGADQDSFRQMAPSDQLATVINTSAYGYDLAWGDSANLTYQDRMGNALYTSKLLGESRRVEFWTNPNGETWMWGTAQPSANVYIETSQGYTLTSFTDALNGNWGVDHAISIAPGDLVTVTVGEGEYPVTIIFPYEQASSDSLNNTVSGYATPDTDVEVYTWWSDEMTTTHSADTGYFSVTFDDVPPQGRGYMRFIRQFGEAEVDAIFHKPFYDRVPSAVVNFTHDWVEGQYDPGYPVVLTVTTELQAIKATASGTTGWIDWWGSETGFSTNSNVTWDGGRPDLEEGDRIQLNINGMVDDVQVGQINGTLDTAGDIFTGIIVAPWLMELVHVDCGVWVENGPGMGFDGIDPNGGSFTCDFSGTFDILPGMDFGVSYYEPDGSQVINVFREPAPHLWVAIDQQGMPAENQNFALRIHYNNDGDGTAVGATISQEFTGLTYLSDTSGFPKSGSGAPGDPFVWQLGDLPTNHWGEYWFDVFFTVDYPDWVSSMAEIESSVEYYQGDPWNKHADWGTDVEPNSTDLNIGKWAWTGDPFTGQKFVYVVNVCNNGSTASTMVTVTDTLPTETSLVEWWSPDPGWELVQETPDLKFERPTLNGNRCSEIDIKVQISNYVLPGTDLQNKAGVLSTSDLSPDNNYADTWVKVGGPYYNLRMGTNWVQGQFVRRGELQYEIWYGNNGNMPVSGAILTTTIPAGAQFIEAFTWDWQGTIPFTPTLVTNEYVVWELDTIPNGYNYNIAVRMKLSNDIAPGTTLVVENRIRGQELEVRYDDNAVIYTEKVNEAGPNLRVDKHTNWWWEEWWDEFNNKHQLLGYELRILNIGTQFLDNPIVTDTLLMPINFGGCWWNHGPFMGCGYDPDTNVVTFTLDYLNPGETASGMLKVDLQPEYVDLQGMEYVNQVRISDFNDIDIEDNYDVVTAYTGPDVFVRKWLKEGELRAGELITYTVEFGNSNRWPWHGDTNYMSHITETLPAGTSYVTAIGYWDPTIPWDYESYNGQQVVWMWGPMWAEATWTFDLVLQIDEDVLPGSLLLNQIEAWGDSPDDIDINPQNNYFAYDLWTILYNFMLPVMQRAP